MTPDQPTATPDADVREYAAALSTALTECDPLAFDNMHASWARESIARDLAAALERSPHHQQVLAAERKAAVVSAADALIEVNADKHGGGCFCLVCAAFRESADRLKGMAAQEPTP